MLSSSKPLVCDALHIRWRRATQDSPTARRMYCKTHVDPHVGWNCGALSNLCLEIPYRLCCVNMLPCTWPKVRAFSHYDLSVHINALAAHVSHSQIAHKSHKVCKRVRPRLFCAAHLLYAVRSSQMILACSRHFAVEECCALSGVVAIITLVGLYHVS